MKIVKVAKDSTSFTLNESDLTDKKVGEGLRTAILNIPCSDGHHWWIEYFPAGYQSLNKNHVSVFICANMPVKAKFTCGVDGSPICKTKTDEFSDTRRGSGWSQFASHEELSPLFCDGKLTITCNVEFFIEVPFTCSPPRLFRCCEHVPTDLELVMGTDRLPVHRNLLSFMSPIFHAILSHVIFESPSGEIEITDFEYDTVKATIDYCYGREIENSVDLYINILRFALKYDMKEVASQLKSIPLCNLSTETFCSITNYAYDHHNYELLAECYKFFKVNHDEIIVVDKFAELPPELVVQLLRTAFPFKTDYDVLHYACNNGIGFILDYVECPIVEKLTVDNFCPAVCYAWECSRNELKTACAIFVNNNLDKVMTWKLDDELPEDVFTLTTLNPSSRPLLTLPLKQQQQNDHIANRDPAIEEAMQLQRLYRRDPKKAMDEVRKNAATRCPLSKRTLYNHFKKTYAASTPTTDEMPSCVPSLPPPLSQNPFATPFSTNLVASRLAAASNTAPGPDRVRYEDWKKLDPTCIVLTSIFNAVRRIKYTPASWKTSTTVLLHKKDQLEDVHNWRPIALSNTMGKLYASCVAWRLAEWCTENHRITNAQKGFMKFEGCLEHNFTVQSVIHMARQQSKEAAVAWLDFRNAFGSVWHTTIEKALTWIGLDDDAVEVIANLYDGCTTRIRSIEGLTDPIPIESGVRQGCPLSPIIFNIAIEPLIRAIREMEEGYLLGGETINIVAYADDLALIARSKDGLQKQLDVAARVAKWAGLTFNVKKCASLHINRRRCRPTTFRLQGEPLAALGRDDHYRHLGLPTGFKYGAAGEDILDNMKTDVESINVSLLAPWQKIDAVRTFVIPQLTFQLKGGMVNRDKLEELDNVIKKRVKKWLSLPARASNEIIYIPHRLGGLNLMPVKELASICDVVEAVHLLHSKDPQVAAVAQSTLQDDVRQKIKQPPTPEIIKDYLDGCTEGIFKGNSVTYSSIWTRLRISARHLRRMFSMEWSCDSAGINLLIDEQRVRPADVEKQLKNAFHKYLAKVLAAKPDQGKVFRVASLSSASNHFLKNGNFTRFAEWRFIHKARLNVVPLRGSLKFNIGSKSCRKCEYPNETLAHVLNHCGTHMTAATKRHNAVAGRLEKVLPRNDHTSIYINQAVPGSNSDLRPDITVIDEKNKIATIIDIAIPFESSKVAMEEARRRKKEKYAGIEQSLKGRGFKTFCDAFVIGSLGSYDPANNACIRRLRIPHRYATLMRRLMVCDVIRWSRNIYVEHLSGVRQYIDGQQLQTIASHGRHNHN